MKKIRISAIIVALCLVTTAVWAGGAKESAKSDAPKTKLVIASDATWPPMEFVNESKEIVGMAPDMLQAISKATGVEIEVKNTAWDGIFAGLSAGSYDAICSSVTITDERKAAMDFSIPYVNAGQVLVVPVDTTGVTTIADLKGKKIGAQIGTTGAIEIAKDTSVTLASYDEIGLAFQDLALGRISGVVSDSPIAADFAMQNAQYKGTLKIVGSPFTDEWLGIAVTKGNTEVLDILNEGLEKIKASGELDEIIAKWIN